MKQKNRHEHLIENLAIALSQVHAHCMSGFYEDWDDDRNGKKFWNRLDQKTNKPNEVDRAFFLRMAESLIEKLEIK
jgi:hypothetical protein